MGAILFILLIFLVFIRIPVAFALAITSFVGFIYYANWIAAVVQLSSIVVSGISSYTLSVVPMFLLMGEFTFQSGITNDLYVAVRKWFGKLPGGLAISTNFAAALFGACSGSTIASCSMFTKISLPEMQKAGYDNRLSTGCIGSAGALACMIPPSILMIIYGIISMTSISKLLIAGILPGLITSLIFGLGIFLIAYFRKDIAPTFKEDVSFKEKLISLKGITPTLFLFLLIIGGLYLGWFTATQGGAMGALGALLILILRRKFTLKLFWQALVNAGMLSCSLLIIVIFGNLFAQMLSMSGMIRELTGVITELSIAPIYILLLILSIYLILGCLVDPVSMLIITTPLVLPIAETFHWHPIWFGIIVITMVEIGVITPPVGMNLFTVKGTAGHTVTMKEIYLGILPFLLMVGVTIVLLILFPDLFLYLPLKM
ncbi:MAG: TRAP transporter large permease [Desulfobacterales bacterium]|jgi:tripartite ATP-independent transporter DctM subunit